MSKQDPILRRLRPFEGLCLTSKDLLDEQTYHRRSLHRHNLYMHGHGIVQGLQVELQQKRKKYAAIIQAGFGVTRMGQGVLLGEAVSVPLEVPKKDGEYMLWLVHSSNQPHERRRRHQGGTQNLKPFSFTRWRSGRSRDWSS